MPPPHAFMRSGRFRVTTATPLSRSSKSTGLVGSDLVSDTVTATTSSTDRLPRAQLDVCTYCTPIGIAFRNAGEGVGSVFGAGQDRRYASRICVLAGSGKRACGGREWGYRTDGQPEHRGRVLERAAPVGEVVGTARIAGVPEPDRARTDPCRGARVVHRLDQLAVPHHFQYTVLSHSQRRLRAGP